MIKYKRITKKIDIEPESNSLSSEIHLHMPDKTINIAIETATLARFRQFNFTPWNALGEFVDNAIQSYLNNKDALLEANGKDYVLKVEIEYKDDELIVRDNAASIADADYARAFSTGKPPPNRKGLSEFGMGMKCAACWFSPFWTVRSSALGESEVKTITFDLDSIEKKSPETIIYTANESIEDDCSFTELTLQRLWNRPRGKSIKKVKEHLADIYRCFTQDGTLKLTWNGEALLYEEPEILEAPTFNNKKVSECDNSREWKLVIEPFEFGRPEKNSGIPLRAHGFVAIRELGSTANAGLSLFRRGRVLLGSGDTKYRPKEIFGNTNDYEYQRIFGEIHIEGVGKSFTTDNLMWQEDDEDDFLEQLKKRVAPLLRQARNYRKSTPEPTTQDVASAVADTVADALQDAGDEAMATAAAVPIQSGPPPPLDSPPPTAIMSRREIDFDFDNKQWRVILEMSDQEGIGKWLTVGNAEEVDGRTQVEIRLALAHPFMTRYSHLRENEEQLDPIFRIAVAAGLTEQLCRDAGIEYAGTFIRKMNALLLEVFTTH